MNRRTEFIESVSILLSLALFLCALAVQCVSGDADLAQLLVSLAIYVMVSVVFTRMYMNG